MDTSSFCLTSTELSTAEGRNINTTTDTETPERLVKVSSEKH